MRPCSAINRSTGQIRTRTSLNHEDPVCGYVSPENPNDPTSCTYMVRVKVADGDSGSVFRSVTITVEDDSESLNKPTAPRVTATTDSGRSLGRELERAVEYGEATHHQLRHTISRGWR